MPEYGQLGVASLAPVPQQATTGVGEWELDLHPIADHIQRRRRLHLPDRGPVDPCTATHTASHPGRRVRLGPPLGTCGATAATAWEEAVFIGLDLPSCGERKGGARR